MNESIINGMKVVTVLAPFIICIIVGLSVINWALDSSHVKYEQEILQIINQHQYRFSNDTNLTVDERLSILESHHILSVSTNVEVDTISDKNQPDIQTIDIGFLVMVVGAVTTIAITHIRINSELE